ncbi:hypothetical protein AWE51_14045 [Aquimarina aggregata]|uniref:Uncharacterized protein n=1 Tax=Aquimarina aggregata TaxID=1642818 RepID=A0A162XM98_9FLAO|nr:tetratricopeptide repeat protein [Aquimarina aggregata]KZS38706.1 hypothetical protein AWE51_14045 [Aquimarina aggregata]
MPRYTLLFYLFFLFGIQGVSYSQEISSKDLDSLVNLDFKTLSDQFYKILETKPSIAILYAKAHLKKGKKEKDLNKIATGFYLTSLTHLDNLEKRIQYIDSAITIRERTKYKKFLSFLYVHKGYVYNINNLFDKSLDHYLEALEYAKKTNNNAYITIAQNNIALLKRKLGKYDEAKSLFKKCLSYRKSRLPEHKNDSIRYLVTLSELIITHIHNKEIDSASILNNQGMLMSLKIKMPKGKEIIRLFKFNKGILDYHKKEYPTAIKNINNALKPNEQLFFENTSLINAYLFLGKSHNALSKKQVGLTYFKKIDSIVQQTNYVIPETRLAYLEIIEYYKSLGDKNNQLLYIDRLLYNDSLFNTYYKSMSTKINKEYDTPKLLYQKEQLISDLQTKKDTSFYGLIFLSIIIILITSFFLLVIKKIKFTKSVLRS